MFGFMVSDGFRSSEKKFCEILRSLKKYFGAAVVSCQMMLTGSIESTPLTKVELFRSVNV